MPTMTSAEKQTFLFEALRAQVSSKQGEMSATDDCLSLIAKQAIQQFQETLDEVLQTCKDGDPDKKFEYYLKTSTEAEEFLRSIARNVIDCYFNVQKVKHGIPIILSSDVNMDEVIKPGKELFKKLDSSKFILERNKESGAVLPIGTREQNELMQKSTLALAAKPNYAQTLYQSLRKIKLFPQAAARKAQITMLQSCITALNKAVQDNSMPLDKAIPVLRHILRTLMEDLDPSKPHNKNSALMKAVLELNKKILLDDAVDPKLDTPERKQSDAKVFISALQTGGALVSLMQDPKCGKLIASKLEQATTIGARLIDRAQQLRHESSSPGPSLAELSPHLTMQKDSLNKQDKTATTKQPEPPIVEDNPQPKKKPKLGSPSSDGG